MVNREWAQVYSRLLSAGDTEVLRVPSAMGTLKLLLSGNEEVQRRRRDMDLNRAEAESARGLGGTLPFLQGASDMNDQLDNRPGRQLNRDASASGGAAFDG